MIELLTSGYERLTPLFKDWKGCSNVSFHGSDRTAAFRAMAGFVLVEFKPSSDDIVIHLFYAR